MDKIRVLQLGAEDWNKVYTVPNHVELINVPVFHQPPKETFDIVFLDRQPLEEEYEVLHKETKAHTLFLTENAVMNQQLQYLYDCKCGKKMNRGQVQEFLLKEARFYFSKPYGEKYSLNNLCVAENFHGEITWNGNREMVLRGSFGKQMKQAAYWKNNIPLFRNQVIDLWLEYQKDPGVRIELQLVQFASGSLSTVINRWRFDETQLENVVQIEGNKGDGPIFASICASGEGQLRIIALHDRYSRGKHGYFLPGGIRMVSSQREELFAYFDPGDRKPPLNVYFSGYKTREGFEGYYMMKNMGCPFLLIAETRLEGGCFYMGSEEYEAMYAQVIRKYMEELGFTGDQVILFGLSMGTTGAAYYSCNIHPHAVMLGKPLMNLGDIAANEKLLRPGGFSTSLDVLEYLAPPEEKAKVKYLNQKFWKKFDAADWSRTKFIVSYMIEDDYDSNGYRDLLDHLQSEGVQVYGKGIHGRHNDNSGAIVQWLTRQFQRLLEEDFGRRDFG